MSEITTFASSSITKLVANLEHYKYNPSAVQQTILDYLEEITNGQVDIVDPTNPFVFLLEASSVNTSLAITESFNNLRLQYPSLAQTEEDLYLHMSNNDFINRFSTPSNTNFQIAISVEDIYNKLLFDPVENCFKATIPRNTEFIVNDITFTLLFPINIRRFNNGIVQVSFDNSIESPLKTLSSNIIDYIIRKNSDNSSWLFFTVNTEQFKIETTFNTIQKSIPFSINIPFTDKFFYVRIYYRNNNTVTWKEMNTTYTDQVFDVSNPTAVIKLFTDNISIFIPSVYVSTEQVSGEIRIDVYNTKGELTVNLNNFKPDAFTVKLSDLDRDNNLNEFTNAFSNLTYYVFNNEIISGGKNGIDFNTLRERVIMNSIGDRQLPITNVQLTSFVNDSGFDVIANTDVITNRIFLASRKLPKPIVNRLLTSSNLGIATVVLNIEDIKDHYNVEDNGERITIKSNTLFLNNNGIIKIINEAELNEIFAKSKINIANLINTNYYIYTPYYYVLDSTRNEFEMRAYHLDHPVASDLNFISQNQSIQLPVNTKTYGITKTDSGYKITLITKSGNFYKQLADSLVNVQLGYYPKNDNSLAYINGELIGKTDDDERIYEFNLISNHDIDIDNYLCITNGNMFNTEVLNTYVPLNSIFNIFYTTSSLTTDFIPDESNSLIGEFLLPVNSVVVTHEKINITLGYSLKNLWTRSRSLASGLDYQTYDNDVPMVYSKDVYETDPVTNSIFTVDGTGALVYNILHNQGDPVLDINNEQVYQHRKGDVVLDVNGDPVIINELSSNKELDLLMVDGKYYFVNDSAFVDYKIEFTDIISNWVTNNITDIQNVLLEQSRIYFYPKTNLGLIKVHIDNNNTDYITAEQSFKLDLYVNSSVYRDLDIRTQLSVGSITILDNFISSETVNMSIIFTELRNYYKDSVISFNLTGLGGVKDYKIARILSEIDRLCLKKKLTLQSNDNFVIEEDVVIEFHNIEEL